MKTTRASKASFEQLKEAIANTNKAATNALSEQQSADAPLSNPEANASPIDNHVTKATAGSAKLKAPKKKKVYEVGIAENVTNGERMVDVLNTFTGFNPINTEHLPASLTVRNIAGRAMINEVRDSKQQKSDDGNARKVVFNIINKKFTKVHNQLMACGAPEGTIANAKTILDLMRTVRKGKPAPGAKTRSVSHRSFSQMVEHVSDYLALLAHCPEYDSNQPELKLTALVAYRDSLLVGNASASRSKAEWDTSLTDRNRFFNEKQSGFVDTFEATKRSVKAIYGGNSPEYHQVAQFQFRRIYS